jgi:hypothetical protein
MAIGGSRARVDRQGKMGPLLTSSPDLPYVFAPPEVRDGALDEWAIVWLALMGIEMVSMPIRQGCANPDLIVVVISLAGFVGAIVMTLIITRTA